MDSTYIFLQHYWWFLVSLLGAILVFLLFVQGGNSLLFVLGRTEKERMQMVNSTGKKWELTFTTLVTFGGAFFASFPLFYSTSFGGAYWLWMIILYTFVLQAVSYEFQSKLGNLLGKKTYQAFLVFNGVVAPIMLGVAVATFFNGANFIVEKENLTEQAMPVISSWANNWHGLEALVEPMNLVLGLAIFFLSRLLGELYFINNLTDSELIVKCRRQLLSDAVPFLVLFVAFTFYVLFKDGYALDASTGEIVLEEYKYLHNFITMPYLLIIFLLGVVATLFGIAKSYLCISFDKGIWFSGIGSVLVVLSLLLCVGYNDTCFYPSNVDLQSSLTIYNSSSSLFTLKTMAYVSILIPFVIVYISYAWRSIDKK